MPALSSAQRRLRTGRPIWVPSRHAATYPSLSGSHETAVAIVGGGMTGALVAYAFASAGVATAVVESGLVGRGSTAASSALLLQEPDLELTALEKRYGARASRRIWRLGHESVAELVALIGHLNIRCSLERRDTVYYAADADGAERLRQEFTVRTRAGFDGEWLRPGALRRLTGIPAGGAIRTTGSAQFDPYRACVGVLRAATATGAEVFEHSPVRRIDVEPRRVRLRTRTGSIEAQRVVIATGYATTQFRPLAGKFRLYRTYVLATERTSAAQRDDLGLSDIMVWDTERPYHYARWTDDHRLLLGGGDRPVRPGQRLRHQREAASRELRAYFEARLPALAMIRTDAAWEGLFAITPDSLPYIGPHPRYPRHWFALGYGGNGMTFGFLAARMLLERWQGRRSNDHALFEFARMG
jgi:glycine/D-amino acid oxidase-like deaminating enzyme